MDEPDLNSMIYNALKDRVGKGSLSALTMSQGVLTVKFRDGSQFQINATKTRIRAVGRAKNLNSLLHPQERDQL